MTTETKKPQMLDVGDVARKLADAQRTLHTAKAKADHLWDRLGVVESRLRLAREAVECLRFSFMDSAAGELVEEAARKEMREMLAEYPDTLARYHLALADINAAYKAAMETGKKVETEVTEATNMLKESLPATPAGDPAGEN